MSLQPHAQLDALGDPTRRAIVQRLLEGPTPVGKLAGRFPVSRPAISQHLRVLKDAGLVVDQAAGNRRIYRLDPRGFDSLREYFETVLERCAGGLQARSRAITPSRDTP